MLSSKLPRECGKGLSPRARIAGKTGSTPTVAVAAVLRTGGVVTGVVQNCLRDRSFPLPARLIERNCRPLRRDGAGPVLQ